MHIKNKKLLAVIKWATYSLLLILFYVLQTTPRLFEIFGVKPVLILPLVVCVSMYEGIMSSAVFAMVAGLMWDISSDKLLGFNAIIFVCCSVLIGLVCIYYLRTKLLNSMGFCLITALLQGVLDFIFYYAIWNYSNVSMILIQNIIPEIAYTTALTPIFYYIVKSIGIKFNRTLRA